MKNPQLPLHFQVSNDLRKRLQSGEWGIGELFPTDKELMKAYGVSSTTVRRSVDEMVREGWLERKPGKGTFIKKQYVETLGKLTGFFDQVREKGYEPSSKLIRVDQVEISEFEDLGLEVFKTKKVFLIEKIQLMDNTPVVLVKSFWPVFVGKKLSEHDLVRRGTYEVAQQELGIRLEEAHQDIYATLAGPEEANKLGISEGAAMLVMQRVVYSQGKPYEVSLNYYRADRYRYRVLLNNDTIEFENGIIAEEK
ncbi:GntR family transcriptional regulator [Desulforamulus aquiferis]|uniref:GntR family transcriptional regulator n=1 Tax=Desulforamulus aquiferis TaxID=1397668 RepID=A0AAW7ZDM5_9FIRM|nr:GntR family transcriptional regulator [Desulforamulus aquiferis]MDO7787595.1 GntR family transcriptional regulator [Desulforamulus aquiferis]